MRDSRLVLSMISVSSFGMRVASRGGRGRTGRSPLRAQEGADRFRHRGGLLEMGSVPRTFHRLDLGPRDLPREFLRVDGWGDPILGAPDEQGGRLHAVDAL